MNTDILSDNLHKKFPAHFSERDPLLARLKNYSFKYSSPLLNRLPTTEGIHTLEGGQLLGKTTLLKQWIVRLLGAGVHAEAITFFSGKRIKNSDELIQLFQTQLTEKPTTRQYIIIDDINYIIDWNKAILWLATKACMQHAIIMLTSADSTLSNQIKQIHIDIKDENNLHIHPLSFRETVLLKHPHTIDLLKEFNCYLLHGGYLPAIYDVMTFGKISAKTFALYSDGIIKELLLHGKHTNFIREILTFIIQHYFVPVSFNGLVKELSIEHPKTIRDYLELLSIIDTLFIQSALIEDKLLPAPKKARKLIFTDPFVFHAIRAYVFDKGYSEVELTSLLKDSDLYTNLAKTCVISHFERHYPTYYIKDEGEVDLVYVMKQRFWPIIISWMSQLRSKDIKQIVKYSNGRILTKTDQASLIENIRTESLLQVLWDGGRR